MTATEEEIQQIKQLLECKNPDLVFRARQLMFAKIPPSKFVETYLNNNEGQLQNLEMFPMMKFIYDNMPQKMVLKCSRKTLKSTLLSNMVCMNLIRYNNYRMMYVGNLEKTSINFSTNFLNARIESPRIKEIIPQGFRPDGVFEKVLSLSKSSIVFKYCENNANRIRGETVAEILMDEVQGIAYDQLPIILESSAILKYKREKYAGTPLTTTNTLSKLWKESNRCEWMTKCGCGHWNSLTEDNYPEKMLLEQGYSCSKCGKLLDTVQGEWVSFAPLTKEGKTNEFFGYHLAQPILPFFNQNPKDWTEIYRKIQRYGTVNSPAVYNEVLGLAFDAADSRPIDEDRLKELCCLGPIYENDGKLHILEKNRFNHTLYTFGADWGCGNALTVGVVGALNSNGIFEVIWIKKFYDNNYEKHIEEIARRANDVRAVGACDGGPDPIRGQKLMQLLGSNKVQLVQYQNSKFIQRYVFPPGGSDPGQGRWVLNRSDCFTYMFKMMREGMILFPDYNVCSNEIKDLLNIVITYKDGRYNQEMDYTHDPEEHDDFAHALLYAFISARVAIGDINLQGASSSAMADPNEAY